MARRLGVAFEAALGAALPLAPLLAYAGSLGEVIVDDRRLAVDAAAAAPRGGGRGGGCEAPLVLVVGLASPGSSPPPHLDRLLVSPLPANGGGGDGSGLGGGCRWTAHLSASPEGAACLALASSGAIRLPLLGGGFVALAVDGPPPGTSVSLDLDFRRCAHGGDELGLAAGSFAGSLAVDVGARLAFAALVELLPEAAAKGDARVLREGLSSLMNELLV
jgi:hypothetical protein